MFEIYYWIINVKIKELRWKCNILNIFNIMDLYLQRFKCFNQSMLAHIGSVNYFSGAITFPAKNTWIMCAWNIHVLWTTIVHMATKWKNGKLQEIAEINRIII